MLEQRLCLCRNDVQCIKRTWTALQPGDHVEVRVDRTHLLDQRTVQEPQGCLVERVCEPVEERRRPIRPFVLKIQK